MFVTCRKKRKEKSYLQTAPSLSPSHNATLSSFLFLFLYTGLKPWIIPLLLRFLTFIPPPASSFVLLFCSVLPPLQPDFLFSLLSFISPHFLPGRSFVSARGGPAVFLSDALKCQRYKVTEVGGPPDSL